MKNGFFTVWPQNMVSYQMSIREADNENDIFRMAFDEIIKADPIPHSHPDYMLAWDFFGYGWSAAVRCLNDDPAIMSDAPVERANFRPSIPSVKIQRYNAFCSLDGGGPADLEADDDGDLVLHSDIAHLLPVARVEDHLRSASTMLHEAGAIRELRDAEGNIVLAYDKAITEQVVCYQEQSMAALAKMHAQACAQHAQDEISFTDEEIRNAMADAKISFFQDMSRSQSHDEMIQFVHTLVKSKNLARRIEGNE